MRNCSINRFTTKKAREPLSGMTQKGQKMTLNVPKWPKMGQKWPLGKRLRISEFCHWNPKNSEIRSKFRNSDTPGASDGDREANYIWARSLVWFAAHAAHHMGHAPDAAAHQLFSRLRNHRHGGRALSQVGVFDASLRMHHLHDVLQFFETSLKNCIVKNWNTSFKTSHR